LLTVVDELELAVIDPEKLDETDNEVPLVALAETT